MYKNNFDSEEELPSCVNEAFSSITQDKLTCILGLRKDYGCLEINGKLCDHLLKQSTITNNKGIEDKLLHYI